MELVIILVGIILANVGLGTVKAIGVDFSFLKLGKGLLDAIKSIIAVAALFVGYIYLAEIDFIGMVYSPVAFFFLGLTGVYYANSCLRNISLIVFKTADIRVIKDLDEWFKKKLGSQLEDILDDPGVVERFDEEEGLG